MKRGVARANLHSIKGVLGTLMRCFTPSERTEGRIRRLRLRLAAVAFAALVSSMQPGLAADDIKPYDDKLLRLAELLGAVHYLRELCGGADGQYWRDRASELIDAEGAGAARRARFGKSFNLGYNSYRRTYNTCTPSAQTAIGRFLTEGAEIADALARMP